MQRIEWWEVLLLFSLVSFSYICYFVVSCLFVPCCFLVSVPDMSYFIPYPADCFRWPLCLIPFYPMSCTLFSGLCARHMRVTLSHVSQAVFWSLCLIPLTLSHVLQAVFWSLCLIPVTTPVSPSCPIAGAHTGTSATLQVGNGVSRVGWFDNRMSCAKKGHFTYIFE